MCCGPMWSHVLCRLPTYIGVRDRAQPWQHHRPRHSHGAARQGGDRARRWRGFGRHPSPEVRRVLLHVARSRASCHCPWCHKGAEGDQTRVCSVERRMKTLPLRGGLAMLRLCTSPAEIADRFARVVSKIVERTFCCDCEVCFRVSCLVSRRFPVHCWKFLGTFFVERLFSYTTCCKASQYTKYPRVNHPLM